MTSSFGFEEKKRRARARVCVSKEIENQFSDKLFAQQKEKLLEMLRTGLSINAECVKGNDRECEYQSEKIVRVYESVQFRTSIFYGN